MYLLPCCHSIPTTLANLSLSLTQDGKSAAIYAAISGHLDIIRYLVEVAKADVNMPTYKCRTIIMFASEYGRFEIVKYLIEECRADRYWEDYVSTFSLSLSLSFSFNFTDAFTWYIRTVRMRFLMLKLRRYGVIFSINLMLQSPPRHWSLLPLTPPPLPLPLTLSPPPHPFQSPPLLPPQCSSPSPLHHSLIMRIVHQ